MFIWNFFEVETGYINTKHPDFLDSTNQTIMKDRMSTDSKHDSFLYNLPKWEQNEILLIEKML